jgi:hypothetical protein
LESTIIVVGIVSLLSVVTLRQDLAGAAGGDAASLGTVARSLVAITPAPITAGMAASEHPPLATFRLNSATPPGTREGQS